MPHDLTADPPPSVPPTRPRLLPRLVVLTLLICAIVAASYFLFRTDAGRRLIDRRQLAAVGADVRGWVGAHPAVGPVVFLSIYVTCALLALPVWWMQVLAGYAFGLVGGIGWSLAGHTCGSLATVYVSRWLGGAWIEARAGRAMRRFRQLSRAMGNSGLLVVLAARVLYMVPFGLSNYAVGLTAIRGRDVALGTILGSIPVVSAWVALGARPGLVADWRFWAIVVGVNTALIVPLVARALWVRRRAGQERREDGRSPGLMAPAEA